MSEHRKHHGALEQVAVAEGRALERLEQRGEPVHEPAPVDDELQGGVAGGVDPVVGGVVVADGRDAGDLGGAAPRATTSGVTEWVTLQESASTARSICSCPTVMKFLTLW
jgi:hypothetical protein